MRTTIVMFLGSCDDFSMTSSRNGVSIPEGGRVAIEATGRMEGTDYHVLVVIKNVGNQVVRFDRVDGSFYPGALDGQIVGQSTRAVVPGGVGPPNGMFELKPGKDEEFAFSTAGRTFLLGHDEKREPQFQIEIYRDGLGLASMLSKPGLIGKLQF